MIVEKDIQTRNKHWVTIEIDDTIDELLNLGKCILHTTSENFDTSILFV